VLRILAASISLRSKPNLSMAEASEDRNLGANLDVEVVLDPDSDASTECKMRAVSAKLWSAS